MKNQTVEAEQPNFETGQTEVVVKKKTVDDRGRESVTTIHKGIVIQRTSSMVRVFNPLPVGAGGDTAPENAELYPIQSNLCWVEVTGRRKFPIFIPLTLRR